MKNPERVAELLAELRTLAENDFERHRLDVLEHDLAAPPTVEVIDDTHQKFDGRIYHKVRKGHFRGSNYIHQSVWLYHYGDIPEGFVVHHIDGNPTNNDVANLQCLSKFEHGKIHNAKHKDVFICEYCGREYTACDTRRNKFCSPQCANAVRNKRQEKERTCVVCGQKFYSRRPNARFCSGKCRGIAKSQNAIEQRTCPICGKVYETLSCEENKTCSATCGRTLAQQNRKNKRQLIKCPVCGKEFIPEYGVKTCSHECGAKLMWQTRRSE